MAVGTLTSAVVSASPNADSAITVRPVRPMKPRNRRAEG
jgi:hypothetical protein